MGTPDTFTVGGMVVLILNFSTRWSGQFTLNTRSAGGASLPESASGGQIDRRVLYRLLIYIMLSMAGKYLKIINCLIVVIYFVIFIHMTCHIGLYQETSLTMDEIFNSVTACISWSRISILQLSCTFHIHI
jgi:hypothetical protein